MFQWAGNGWIQIVLAYKLFADSMIRCAPRKILMICEAGAIVVKKNQTICIVCMTTYQFGPRKPLHIIYANER